MQIEIRPRYSDRRLAPTDRDLRRLTADEIVAKYADRKAKQRFFVDVVKREGMISDGVFFETLTYGRPFETRDAAERFVERVRKAGKITRRFWFGDQNFGRLSRKQAAANIEAACKQ